MVKADDKPNVVSQISRCGAGSIFSYGIAVMAVSWSKARQMLFCGGILGWPTLLWG